MRSAHFAIVLMPMLICGCVTKAPVPGTRADSSATALIASGFALAEDQCSGCHAVAGGQDSPNPQAPTFEAVANELAFTPATLREFFLDGHETPAQMSLQLEEEDAEAVTAYIMSLRKPG